MERYKPFRLYVDTRIPLMFLTRPSFRDGQLEELARVSEDVAQSALQPILSVLYHNRYSISRLEKTGYGEFALDEYDGARVALILWTLSVEPDPEVRMRLKTALMSMVHEETLYWFAKTMQHGSRAIRALRLLLTDN